MRSSTISILAAACIVAVFGCGEAFPDDDYDEAEPQLASAALSSGRDPGRITRADGGFQCPPVPCPSNAPWSYELCRCVPRKALPDGGACLPEPCPPGTKFTFDSCSCAASAGPSVVSVTRADDPPVTPDAGTCDPIPCPPMAPFDPVTCSCQGIVADPSDDPVEDVQEVEPAVSCGTTLSRQTHRRTF